MPCSEIVQLLLLPSQWLSRVMQEWGQQDAWGGGHAQERRGKKRSQRFNIPTLGGIGCSEGRGRQKEE